MFKIHENGDGSTSILCNKTGKLICTIRGQQKNMGLGCRPVNVVEQSPKPRSCCYNLDIKSETEQCLLNGDDEISRKETCNLATWDEPKEDFYDDCITPDEFARCLNLISKEKFNKEPIEQLRSSFPLRLLSRTKESLSSENSRDTRVLDYIPITSSSGIKMLKQNTEKNFYSDQNISMKIKNYNSFCRFQLSVSSEFTNYPKLRCREKREYPVCITQKSSRYMHTHMYTFNKKQKLEKLLTFKTGLDTRSRRLLLKCNKRLAVSIKRLTPEEINIWPQKRSKIGPRFTDLIHQEKVCVSSDSEATVSEPNSPMYIDITSSDSEEESSDSDDPSVEYPAHKEKPSFKGVLDTRLPPLRNKNGKFAKFLSKDCCVSVKNVLHRIQKRFGDYFVAESNIRVPFCKDFLNSLDQKVLSGIVIPETNLKTNSWYDHAYHRPFSQEAYRNKLLNSQCLIQKSPPKIKDLLKDNSVRRKSNSKCHSVHNSSSLKTAVNKTTTRIEDQPVIDLTEDFSPDPPIKEIKAQKSGILKWIFQCYGCGFKQTSLEESTVYPMARQHMSEFHCVTDFASLLSVTTTQSGSILEAFPGYKSF